MARPLESETHGMRPRPLHSSVLLALAMLVLASGAQAQDAAARNGVRACAAERRDPERLACYDALARTLRAAAQRSEAKPATPSTTAVAPADIGSPPARERREDQKAAQDVVSTVTAVREIQPGRLEITLANGEVWRQVTSDRYPLQVGHEVRVYPTRFGSFFRLTALKLRSFVQVERVR
jgi:hypothetical protein